MLTFNEILKNFKESEEPEVVISLLDDEVLRKAVVSWKSIRIGFVKDVNENVECPHKSEVEQWNWMWEQVAYEKEKIQVLAGVKPQDLQQLLTRLTMLRLVYPDGTINSFATQYIKALIMQKLPKQKAPPKQTAKQKNES